MFGNIAIVSKNWLIYNNVSNIEISPKNGMSTY